MNVEDKKSSEHWLTTMTYVSAVDGAKSVGKARFDATSLVASRARKRVWRQEASLESNSSCPFTV